MYLYCSKNINGSTKKAYQNGANRNSDKHRKSKKSYSISITTLEWILIAEAEKERDCHERVPLTQWTTWRSATWVLFLRRLAPRPKLLGWHWFSSFLYTTNFLFFYKRTDGKLDGALLYFVQGELMHLQSWLIMFLFPTELMFVHKMKRLKVWTFSTFVPSLAPH